MSEPKWSEVLDAVLDERQYTAPAGTDSSEAGTVAHLARVTGDDVDAIERELDVLERWGLVVRNVGGTGEPPTDESTDGTDESTRVTVDLTADGFRVAHDRRMQDRQYDNNVLVGLFAFVVAFSMAAQVFTVLFRPSLVERTIVFAGFFGVLLFVVAVVYVTLEE